MKYAEAVKQRVDALLEETGLKATDLIERMGIGTSTYYDMWKNGYVTVDRVGTMAEVFGVPISRLLPGGEEEGAGMMVSESVATYGAQPRYIEERVAWLEAEVRKLKEKHRPR